MEKEWTIEKSLNKCSSCAKEFDQKQEYFSQIFDSGGVFVRKDFCLACWKGPDASAYSFWRTRAAVKEEKPKRFIDLGIILDFFKKLGSSEEKAKVNFRYILALVLMRKRKLKFEGAKTENNSEILTLQEAGTDNLFSVKNPKLTEQELNSITQQVGQILNMDLRSRIEQKKNV